ncbi:hypothetical protein [Nocardia sp. NPDC019395]|uniref:hypothetical protein n=1 Tax=Nocardia sp. NPDC019395 TaxID=3154686 RepID=UPI0033F39476
MTAAAFSLPTAPPAERPAQEPVPMPHFPTGMALLSALRSPTRPAPELAQWARRLHSIYSRRTGTTPLSPELRRDADNTINEINAWVARNVQRANGGATMSPVSLGELISRIVRTEKRSNELPVSEVHAVWTRLAQHVQAYDDLLRGVTSGRYDLPDYLAEVDQL